MGREAVIGGLREQLEKRELVGAPGLSNARVLNDQSDDHETPLSVDLDGDRMDVTCGLLCVVAGSGGRAQEGRGAARAELS